MFVLSHIFTLSRRSQVSTPTGKKSLLTVLLLGILWTQPKESAVPVQGGCGQASSSHKEPDSRCWPATGHTDHCISILICFELHLVGRVWSDDMITLLSGFSVGEWVGRRQQNLSDPFCWSFLSPLEVLKAEVSVVVVS